MSVLSHKGYQGSVTFEEDVLVIKVLHIDDTLITECTSAIDAQKAFEELVDDYLETCAELNTEPDKPFKGSFNVRVSPAIHREAAMAAAEVGESLNGWIAQAIETRLQAELNKKKARWNLVEAAAPPASRVRWTRRTTFAGGARTRRSAVGELRQGPNHKPVKPGSRWRSTSH